MLQTIVKSPCVCSCEDIYKFCKVVCESDLVSPCGLTERVKRAEALVFLYTDAELVGVAALKKSSDLHRSEVFEKADSQVSAEEFTYEVGWVFVLPEYRGNRYSRNLVEAALSRAEHHGVFAMMKTDNTPMLSTFTGCGFHKEGKSFRSDRGRCYLDLMVLRQHDSRENPVWEHVSQGMEHA